MNSQKNPQIIDFHIHTFPDKIAEKTLSKLKVFAGIEPVTNGTVADTLSKMDDFGIDMFVCLNIATSLTAHTTINNTVAEYNEKYSDKFISFGSVNPLAPDALSELDRIKSLGIKGIKLHPDYQGFFTHEEKLYDFYQKCSDLGLIVVFHAGWDCYSPNLIHSAPEMNARVAKLFPDLKMVLAHFGALRMYGDVYDKLAGLPNVWFDTAMCGTYGPDTDLAMKILGKHPADHILFGSDCPWENPRSSLEYVDRLPISDDRKEMIFSKNALKLLGITG